MSLTDMVNEEVHKSFELMKKLAERDIEIEQLKKALDRYGKHESGCRYYYAENKCTCGLQQALKEGK